MMDSERFLAAQTFDEFVAGATKYQELWSIGARRASVPADVIERLEQLSSPVRLIALNEDWCLDAIGIVPYIAKLGAEHALLEFRSFGRDANPDLMNSHLTGTARAIPVAIAYDVGWNEIGWWGPRPAELQTWVRSEGAALPPAEKYRYLRQWYARDHGASTLREIADLIVAARAATT